jgi:hypothetical protein
VIGSIIGTFFLSVFGLLVLLLVFPVVFVVRFEGGKFVLKIRLLWVFPITLLGGKPKTEAQIKRAEIRAEKKKKRREAKAEKKKAKLDAKKAKLPPKEEKAEEQAEPKKKSFSEILDMISRGLNAASKAARIMLKGLFFYKIRLFVPVRGKDAADTALKTGQIQAAIGTARGAAENVLHLRWRRIVIYPDFTGETRETFVFSCKILLIPVIMAVAALLGLITFIMKKKDRPKIERNENHGERKQRPPHKRPDGHDLGKNPPDGG